MESVPSRTDKGRTFSRRRWLVPAAVTALVLAHLGIVNHSLWNKSATWDEPLWV